MSIPISRKLSMKFDSELENEYKAYTTENDVQSIRYAFFAFAVLFAVFGITDKLLVPVWYDLFISIRFFLVIPLFLMTIGLTFHRNYYLWKEFLLFINFLVSGVCISIMLILEPMNILYYGGLFLIFTAGFFILRLSAITAIIAGFLILLSLVIGVVFTKQFNLSIMAAFLFLSAQSVLGAIGAYQIERYKRSEFLSMHQITEEIQLAQISTIRALANLAESRDKNTGEHIDRVGKLCYRFAKALPITYFKTQMDKERFCRVIEIASVLHDIGKVGISDAILNKPGPLNQEEFEIMKTHSQIGANTLSKLHAQYPQNYFVQLGIEITSSHHEHFDGKGYPQGLKGYDIPLSARIMAIVDVYDALVNVRPYKPAFSHQRAIEIIMAESGTHFDPELVRIFCTTVTK
ncbi:MAG: HD domain-containing protein [Tissierellales bacterium]|nr:HD domain-containing protein [Tissierellales bacterium]